MDNNFFQLPETTKALAELSTCIVKLTSGFKAEREKLLAENLKCKNDLEQKEDALNNLQTKSSAIIDNLDNIISQLDKVLEKNGSSNNNN